MVEKWKIALKEFLKEYEEDDKVIGAVLCGSYANDTYNELSDIDVYLLLKDNVNYSFKGCTESNSYLIEYYMNTSDGIKESMAKEFNSGINVTATMFAYGKIIYDLDGNVKKLQTQALDYIDRPIKSITSRKLDENNYLLWNCLDELKVALKEERIDFNKIYYRLLDDMFDVYLEYESIPKLPKTKIYKILTNEEYRKKMHVFKLPDKRFIELYLKCYEETKSEVMYKNISNLINYYYEKQGGFNIRTFNLKTERNDY